MIQNSKRHHCICTSQDHFLFDEKSTSSQMETSTSSGISASRQSPGKVSNTGQHQQNQSQGLLKTSVSDKCYANGLHRPKFLLLPRAPGLTNHMIISRGTLRKSRDSLFTARMTGPYLISFFPLRETKQERRGKYSQLQMQHRALSVTAAHKGLLPQHKRAQNIDFQHQVTV